MKKYLLVITLLLANASYGMMSTAHKEIIEINEYCTYKKFAKISNQLIGLATNFKDAQSKFLTVNGAKEGDTSVTLIGNMNSSSHIFFSKTSTYPLKIKGVDLRTFNENLLAIQSLLPNHFSLKFLSSLKKETPNLDNVLSAFHAKTSLQSAIDILQPQNESLFKKIIPVLKTQKDALETVISRYITGLVKETNPNMLNLVEDYQDLTIDQALAAKIKALLLLLKDENQYGKPEAAAVQWGETNKTETISAISFPLIPNDESFQWELTTGSLELQNYKPTGGEIHFFYDPWGFGEYKSTVPFKGDIKSVYKARKALLDFVKSIKIA